MALRLIPALQRAEHALSAFIDAQTNLRLTPSDAFVLAHLATHGPSSVGQIYSAFGHKRSTLTSILNRLEDRELVTCTVHEVDKRSFLIDLTPRGEMIARDIYEKLVNLEAEILRAFPSRDQKNILELLSAVTAVTDEKRSAT